MQVWIYKTCRWLGSVVTSARCLVHRNADLFTLTQVRTWNFPALVRYLTPLNGLYLSPNMSRRLTLRPDKKRGRHQFSDDETETPMNIHQHQFTPTVIMRSFKIL